MTIVNQLIHNICNNTTNYFYANNYNNTSASPGFYDLASYTSMLQIYLSHESRRISFYNISIENFSH